MLILGLDPGSRRTGWGLIHPTRNGAERVASGVLRLPEGAPLGERLLLLDSGLNAILAEHQPEACAVEQLFMAKNARSALVLGHARGVLLCAAARAGVPVHEYTPALVKQAVVGQGRAGKEQVQRMVTLLLGLTDALAEDEADALGVALTHAAALRMPGRAQGAVLGGRQG